MANYNVDIAVAVKAAALNTFNQKLKTTEKNIGNINTLLRATSKATGSFNDLSQSLGAANLNLNAAVRGTRSYKLAILQAARAERELNRELSARSRIQSQLTNSGSGFAAFSQKADQLSGRQLRTEPLRITRQRRKGLRQYSSAIGPSPQVSGAALPPNFNQEIAAATAAARGVETLVTKTAQKRKSFAEEISQLELGFNKKLETAEFNSRLKKFESEKKLNKEVFDDLIKLDNESGKRFDKELKRRTNIRKKANREAEERRSARKQGLQNAALGVGFPLLFGGGAGSVIGGGLGSVGGFGGQVIGSAIGQQLDQFARKTAELGVALSKAGLDVGAVTKAAGELGSEAERLISELEEVVGAEEAAAVATNLLANKIGEDGVRALEEFGAAGQELGAAVSELNTEFMVLAATLLGPVVKGIAGLIQRANLASQTSAMLRAGGPEAERIRAARRASMEQGGSADDATIAGQAEAAKILEERRQKALSAARDASLENSKALQIAEKENEILQLNGDLTDKVVYLKKQELIDLEAEAKLNKENVTDLQEKIIEQERLNELKNLENQRDEENRRKAEESQRKLQEDLKKRRQLQANLLAESSKQQKIENKITEATEGRAVAIERELADMQAAYTADAQRIILATESRDLAQEKVNTLAKEYELKQLLLRQEYTELQLKKDLLAIEQKQTLSGIGTDLTRQIEDANLRPTGNAMQDQQLELRISQIRRQEDARRSLTDQIEKERAAILRYSEVGNASGVMDAQERVEGLQEQIALYDRLLPQLDAAEQAQLKFNQALEAAKPFADAFTSGLLDGMVAVVDGTKTAEQAFADFLNNIAKMLIQTAQQMIAQYIALAIARMFAIPGNYSMSGGGMPFGGSGAAPAGLNTSNMTGFFNPGAFTGRANGGSVSGNRPYLVGERGPELFVPGAQGNIVPNSAMGSANVTVNVDASGSSVEGDSEGAGQLGKLLGAAVQAELIKQKRPGGLLA